MCLRCWFPTVGSTLLIDVLDKITEGSLTKEHIYFDKGTEELLSLSTKEHKNIYIYRQRNIRTYKEFDKETSIRLEGYLIQKDKKTL